MEADEVTVVVHGARSLQGKKPGRCKFSVIFGVGSKKYRTSIVKEPTGNPDWNEESVIPVQNTSDHVFFTVTEKDDVLGQVQLPVTSLQTIKGQVRKTSLKAHKKCPVPQGELIFQAYVSKQRPLVLGSNPQIKISSPAVTVGGSQQLTGFARLRHSLAGSPILPHRTMKREGRDAGGGGEDKRKSSTLANFNKKLSKSIHDIFHLGRLSGNDDDDVKPGGGKLGKFGGSVGRNLDHLGDVPVVSNIIPNMATVHGGTRLCIEGRNLGLGKSDIMEFLLCGSDLLDTIEFESDTRIYVTTKSNTPGKGDLWIETVSGGQNVIKSVFTFVDRNAERTTGSLERQAPPSPTVIPPSPDRATPPQPSSIVGTTRAKSVLLDDSDLTPAEINRAANHHNTSLTRSSSQQDKSTLPSLTNASTLLRVKSTTDLKPAEAHAQPEAPGRFRKKHSRNASESVVAMARDAEGRSSASEKMDLQKEIVRLVKENESLRQDNADLHTYIEKLVARVLISCPEVLAAGEDLKMPVKKI